MDIALDIYITMVVSQAGLEIITSWLLQLRHLFLWEAAVVDLVARIRRNRKLDTALDNLSLPLSRACSLLDCLLSFDPHVG